MSEQRDGEDAPGESLKAQAEAAAWQSARGNVPGGPTWPMPAATSTDTVPAPPVGLNWTVVADRTGMDIRILQHDGAIVLVGEYFPEAGYFVDPATFKARYVDVGEIALRRGYLLGDMAIREFHGRLDRDASTSTVVTPVIREDTGPIIGLFPERLSAERAKQTLLQGSMGAGFSIEEGPLGVELRVRQPEIPGRVATVICSNGGAVIAVSGAPLEASAGVGGPMATGALRGHGDARRGGIGASSDTQAQS
jgi:hypothetical protein